MHAYGFSDNLRGTFSFATAVLLTRIETFCVFWFWHRSRDQARHLKRPTIIVSDSPQFEPAVEAKHAQELMHGH